MEAAPDLFDESDPEYVLANYDAYLPEHLQPFGFDQDADPDFAGLAGEADHPVVADQPSAACIVDLTGSDDMDIVDTPLSNPQRPLDDGVEEIPEVVCLQMIVDVFPDISCDHVLGLINSRNVTNTTRCQELISSILDAGAYPKERDKVNARKRKRAQSESDEDSSVAQYFKGGHASEGLYRHKVTNLLKDEFLAVTTAHIESVVNAKKTLFHSYIMINAHLQDYDQAATPLLLGSRPRPKRGYEDKLVAAGDNLPKELHAAKRRVARDRAKREAREEVQRLEQINLEHAQVHGEMSDCQCCFNDLPINRLIPCSGDTVHFICKQCIKKYVETEMGQARCRPVCFAERLCGGTFSRSHLQDCLEQTTFDRLEHLQQQEDLRLAGLDFLEECPFCDYKAELPPVEIDKEFRCENPNCAKTSCRLCHRETHIPRSCAEMAQDEKLNVRHTVEEAKSAALIRHCNKCKNPFIKEFGCNKMSCTQCGNKQCYVCSKTINNYEHFGNGNGQCPLHDNHEARHEQEIDRAERAALAKIRAERPDISEAELKIEVSDRVKKQEQDRIRRGRWHDEAFDFHMDGNELRRGRLGAQVRPVAVPAAVPAPARAPVAAPAARPAPAALPAPAPAPALAAVHPWFMPPMQALHLPGIADPYLGDFWIRQAPLQVHQPPQPLPRPVPAPAPAPAPVVQGGYANQPRGPYGMLGAQQQLQANAHAAAPGVAPAPPQYVNYNGQMQQVAQVHGHDGQNVADRLRAWQALEAENRQREMRLRFAQQQEGVHRRTAAILAQDARVREAREREAQELRRRLAAARGERGGQ